MDAPLGQPSTATAPSPTPASSSVAVTEAHRIYLSHGYFPLLDGLRCLAIVAVVWHHAAGISYTGLLFHGTEGVSLFFVISGFLITTILLREQSGTGNISLRRFYLRRTFRIFPLYYAMLTIYVVLVFSLERHSVAGQQFWKNLPYFLTYTSNWFVPLNSERIIFFFAWSLAAEEQFYFFWPWIIKVSTSPRLPIVTMLVLVLLHYGAVFAVTHGLLPPTWFSARVFVHLSPPICLGALAAVLLHRRGSFYWVNPWFGWRWSATAALAATIAALSLDATPDWIWYATMTWLTVACVLRPQDQPLSFVLCNPLVKHVGIVSYGVYLMHMLGVNFVRQVLHLNEGLLLFVLALVVTVTAATLSYRYFESPFLRWKDRLAQSRNACV